jgi:hypothetical protein
MHRSRELPRVRDRASCVAHYTSCDHALPSDEHAVAASIFPMMVVVVVALVCSSVCVCVCVCVCVILVRQQSWR